MPGLRPARSSLRPLSVVRWAMRRPSWPERWAPSIAFPQRPAMQRPNRRRRSDFPKSSTFRRRLADGVYRLTDGYGADIIIDGLGVNILSEALQILAPGGSL